MPRKDFQPGRGSGVRGRFNAADLNQSDLPFSPAGKRSAGRTQLNAAQEEAIRQHIGVCREALGRFVDTPVFAGLYAQKGPWQTWQALAQNRLTPECGLSTHVRFVANAIVGVVSLVVPNEIRGPGAADMIRDHALLEEQKAKAAHELAVAGSTLLGVYPASTPDYNRMRNFLNEKRATSADWLQKATKAAQNPDAPARRAGPSAGPQQKLFD